MEKEEKKEETEKYRMTLEELEEYDREYVIRQAEQGY